MTPEASTLLEGLRGRPEFQEIVAHLKKERSVSYKPARRLDSNTLSPAVQERNWIYDSGVLDENTRIINELLGVTR